MTTTVLREELHTMLDTIPERSLHALKPLLSVLAEPLYTVEPASPEEITMINEGMAEYYKDPSSFIPLENIK